MILLLDQNISRRILPALAETWPGSSQAGLLGLDCASDLEIWEYARDQGFENNRRDDVLVSRTKTTSYKHERIVAYLANEAVSPVFACSLSCRKYHEYARGVR